MHFIYQRRPASTPGGPTKAERATKTAAPPATGNDSTAMPLYLRGLSAGGVRAFGGNPEIERGPRILPPDGVHEHQVRKTIDQVEDEMSGLPKKDPPPPPSVNDGRMYPPLDDRVQPTVEGGLQTDTRGQKIELGPDGSIKVTSKKTGAVEFSKPGGG